MLTLVVTGSPMNPAIPFPGTKADYPVLFKLPGGHQPASNSNPPGVNLRLGGPMPNRFLRSRAMDPDGT